MQSLSRNRSRQGGARGGMSETGWRGKAGTSARHSQRQAPGVRALSNSVPHPASPALELTALSQEKRRQLAALEASGMTAGLRQEVEGRTRLASLRPTGPERLVARRVFTPRPSRGGEVVITVF